MALLEGHRPDDHLPLAVGIGEALADPQLFGKDGHRLRWRGAVTLRPLHNEQGYPTADGMAPGGVGVTWTTSRLIAVLAHPRCRHPASAGMRSRAPSRPRRSRPRPLT